MGWSNIYFWSPQCEGVFGYPQLELKLRSMNKLKESCTTGYKIETRYEEISKPQTPLKAAIQRAMELWMYETSAFSRWMNNKLLQLHPKPHVATLWMFVCANCPKIGKLRKPINLFLHEEFSTINVTPKIILSRSSLRWSNHKKTLILRRRQFRIVYWKRTSLSAIIQQGIEWTHRE